MFWKGLTAPLLGYLLLPYRKDAKAQIWFDEILRIISRLDLKFRFDYVFHSFNFEGWTLQGEEYVEV